MVKRVSELRHGVIVVVEVCVDDVDETTVEVVVPVVDVLIGVVLEDTGVDVVVPVVVELVGVVLEDMVVEDVVPVVEVLVSVVLEAVVAVVDVLAGVVLEIAVEDITRVENADVEKQRISRTLNLQ